MQKLAEKALICYRCGAATTEPSIKPPSKPRRSPVASLAVSVLALGLLALVAVSSSRAPSAQTTWPLQRDRRIGRGDRRRPARVPAPALKTRPMR